MQEKLIDFGGLECSLVLLVLLVVFVVLVLLVVFVVLVLLVVFVVLVLLVVFVVLALALVVVVVVVVVVAGLPKYSQVSNIFNLAKLEVQQLSWSQ